MEEDLLKRLGAESLGDAFPAKWGRAREELPPARYAERFLAPAALEAHLREDDLDRSFLPPLLAMAGRVGADEDLLALAAYAHWRIFLDTDTACAYDWPSLETKLGDEAPLFYLLVATGFGTAYAERQRPLSIPEEVIRNTRQQTARYAENFRYATGRPGIFVNQLCWLHHYFPPARYYRIGRLEFCQGVYDSPYRFYRNRWSGRIVALALDGVWCTAEGRAPFPDLPRPADAWQTTFEEKDGFAAGYPVAHGGRVQQALLRLPLSSWEVVLKPGDTLLETHIPGGGAMRPDLVRDSLVEALRFFDARFPGNGIRAFASGSWIFSPDLREILPADSNILAFQDMLHLLPCGAPRDDGLWFVYFQSGLLDPATLPRDTSLRRSIADWLAQGRFFQAGAMVLLREEVEAMDAIRKN